MCWDNEELRRQRDAVRAHLAWLEARLKEAEGTQLKEAEAREPRETDSTESEVTPTLSPQSSSTQPVDSKGIESPAKVVPPVAAEVEETGEVSVAEGSAPTPDEQTREPYHPGIQVEARGLSQGQKLGCWIFFILATLAGLSIFWALPFFLYD